MDQAEDGGGSEKVTEGVTKQSQVQLQTKLDEGSHARTDDKQGNPFMPPEAPSSQATSVGDIGPLAGTTGGISCDEMKQEAPKGTPQGDDVVICSKPAEDTIGGVTAAASMPQEEMARNGSDDAVLVGTKAPVESNDGPGSNGTAENPMGSNGESKGAAVGASNLEMEVTGKCSDPAPSPKHGDDSPSMEEGTLELGCSSNDAPPPDGQPLSLDTDGGRAKSLEGREGLPLHKLPTPSGIACTPKPEDGATCDVDPIQAEEFVSFDVDDDDEEANGTKEQGGEGEQRATAEDDVEQCDPPAGTQGDANMDAAASEATAATDDASKKPTAETDDSEKHAAVEAPARDEQEAPITTSVAAAEDPLGDKAAATEKKESPEGTSGATEGVPVPSKETSGSADGAAAPAGNIKAAKPQAAQGSKSTPSANQLTDQQQMLRNAALAALAAQQKSQAPIGSVKKAPLKEANATKHKQISYSPSGAADKKQDKEKATHLDNKKESGSKLDREKEKNKPDRERAAKTDREKDKDGSRPLSERKRNRDEEGRDRGKRDDKDSKKDRDASSSRVRDSRRGRRSRSPPGGVRRGSPPGGVSWTTWTAREKEKEKEKMSEKEKAKEREKAKDKDGKDEALKREKDEAAKKDALLRGPLGSRLKSRSREGGSDPAPPQKASVSWKEIARGVEGRRRGEQGSKEAPRAPLEEQRKLEDPSEEELMSRRKALKDLRGLLGELFARSASQCDDEEMRKDHPEYGAISLGHLKGTFRTIHKYPIDAKRIGFPSLSDLITSEFGDICFQVEGDIIPNSEPPKTDKLLIPRNIDLFRGDKAIGGHLGRPAAARSPSPPPRRVPEPLRPYRPEVAGGGARPEIGMRTMRDPPDVRRREASEGPGVRRREVSQERPGMNLRRGGMRSPSPPDGYGDGRRINRFSSPPRDGRHNAPRPHSPPRDGRHDVLRPPLQDDRDAQRGRPLYPPQRRGSRDGGRGELLRDDPMAMRIPHRGGDMMLPSRGPQQSPPRRRFVSPRDYRHDFDEEPEDPYRPEERLIRIRLPPNGEHVRRGGVYGDDGFPREDSRMVAVGDSPQAPQGRLRQPARRPYADDFEDEYGGAYERPVPLRIPLRLPSASLPDEEVEPYEPEFVTTPVGTPVKGYGASKRPRAEEEQGDDHYNLRQRSHLLAGDQKRFRGSDGGEYAQPLREAALAKRLNRFSQQEDDRSFPDGRHHPQQQHPRHHQMQRQDSNASVDRHHQPIAWPSSHGDINDDIDHAATLSPSQGSSARRIVYISNEGPPSHRDEEHSHRDGRGDTSPIRAPPGKKPIKAVSDLRTLLLDKLKLGRPYRMSLVLQDFQMRFGYRFKKDALGIVSLGGVLDKYCSDIVQIKTTVEGGHKEILPVSPAALDSPGRRPHQQSSPTWPPPRLHERPSAADPRGRHATDLERDLRSFLSDVVRNKLNSDGFYNPSKLIPEFTRRFGYKPDFHEEGYRKMADYIAAVAGDIVECISGQPPRTHCEIWPARRR